MDIDSVVHWGILGCAQIARKNIRAIRLSPFAKLVALASRDRKKAEQFVIENSLSEDSSLKIYTSYDDLLNDDQIDAVYIPLPTAFHLEWVRKAAVAKKHILVEKPVALSIRDLRDMIAVCRENNVNLMDGVMFMHHKRLQSILHVLTDPIPRQVKLVQSSFSFNGGSTELMDKNIRTNASCDPLGALGDLGWYCVRIGILAFSGLPHDFMNSKDYDYKENGNDSNQLPWKLVPTRLE